MSLFSYLDTRAPSTEDILAVETEYNEDGSVKEPSFVDDYELKTEFSLQRLASLFGSLSVIWLIVGTFITGWLTYTTAKSYMSITELNANQTVVTAGGSFASNALVALVAGLLVTAIVFALLRLARGFVNYMLVRLLQTEED